MKFRVRAACNIISPKNFVNYFKHAPVVSLEEINNADVQFN